MAKVTTEQIKAQRPLLRHSNSNMRQSARKIGLYIPEPDPSLPKTEQEEADIA